MDHDLGPVGPGWLVTLESSPLAEALRGLIWLYPLVEVTHILGFALMVGAIAAFDLRLWGIGLRLSADALARLLLPVALTGFALAAPSGVLLFVTEATALAANPAFQIKLALLALALANIAAFHRGSGARIGAWTGSRPPVAARLAGGLSLALWTGVLIAGRLIAYV
jgi:hypothetical protein